MFILTIGQILPLQFSDEITSLFFYFLILLTLPSAILLTLLKPAKNSTGTRKGLTIAAAVISFIILIFFFFGKIMCGYITDKTLFVNKSDTTMKIVKKYYDCGATDSSFPEYEFYKTKPLIKPILYSKKIDTLYLNKSDWVRINN